MRNNLFSVSALVLMGAGLVSTGSALAADTAAAESLLKKSNCSKCHAIDKKKEGPSLKEIAKKYKGQADAEAKLVKHLTTNPKVKVDGEEEEHANLKTKNEAEVKNVVQHILSL